MIAVRLMSLFPLVLTLVLLHALPLMPKRSRLFGVDVPREVRYGSEGARLLRSYQVRLLPFGIVASLAACWVPLAWLWLSVSVAVAAARWLLYRCHADAVRFALPPPSIREASLSDDAGGLVRRLRWFAPPLVLLTATGLYLYAYWSRIPKRLAIHFDLNGNPNGWASKTVPRVLGPLAFGAAIVLYMMALYIVMKLGSGRGTRRSVMLATLAAPAYLIGASCAMVGLLPFFVFPGWAVRLLVGAFLAGYVALLVRVLSRPADGLPEVTPDPCWHGGFYYNPEDPALFVEARTGGFGYAINFPRRLGWVLMAVIALLTLGLVLLARMLFAQAPTLSPW
jgi:uncharacterized membrane protein